MATHDPELFFVFENCIEILFCEDTGEYNIGTSRNSNTKEAMDILPGCTHAAFRNEDQTVYYKIVVDGDTDQYEWESLFIQEGDEVPPQLLALASITFP